MAKVSDGNGYLSLLDNTDKEILKIADDGSFSSPSGLDPRGVIDIGGPGWNAGNGGDDSAIFQRALDTGRSIYCRPGKFFNVNNLLVTKSGFRIFTDGGDAGALPALIKKNANGPMFTVVSPASFFKIEDVQLDGNGANFTGVGIDVQFADFSFKGGRIINMDSYCIDFTTADNTARGLVSHCQLARTDSSPGRPMIRLAPDTTVATDKRIVGVTCAGDLLDTNSSQACVISGCSFQNIIFQSGSKKMTIVGNRMATLGASTTVQGVNHTIVGNAHADHFILHATLCSSCVVGPNVCVTPCVDLSPANANNILIDAQIFSMSGGWFELGEIADPAAPMANKGRLYVRDNGAGKSQVVVRFPTGAVQVIATEP